MRIFQLLALLAVLCFSQSARAIASSDRYVVSATSVMPVQGIWWNEALAGSGYNLSIDGKGFIFLTWFTYRADGTSTFYVMSGQFVTPCGNATPVSKGCLAQKLEWSRTGIIGRLTSPIYEPMNGACPTCEYRPITSPVAVSALGNGEVVFFGNRVAELRFLNKVIKINPQPLIETIDQQLLGAWKGKEASVDLAGNPVVRDSFSPRVITRAPELDGLLKPAPDGMRLNQTYMPITVSPLARVYRFLETALIAVEPNGRIYVVGQGPFGREFEYSDNGGSEVFLEGNRMVIWTKSFYKPVFGSTVGMESEADLRRYEGIPAGATVDLVQ